MYTVEKVLDIIKNYKHYQEAICNHKKEYASVGVAQGGIESVMPKAQGGTSDPTGNEAIKHVEDITAMSKIATDIKYVQDRLDRVPKEYEAILDLRLSGHTVREIAFLQHRSYSYINKSLKHIAECIVNQT